jgi:hypothetical protein
VIFFVGTAFLCSVLIAPIRNENGTIMMYIVNLEDVTSSPDLVDVNMGKYVDFYKSFSIVFRILVSFSTKL